MKFTFTYFLFFSLFSFLFPNYEAVEAPKEEVQLIVKARENCQGRLDIVFDAEVHLYKTFDRFDFTDKEFYDIVTPTEYGYFANLEDGYYYYEVFSSSGEKIIYGTFTYPYDVEVSGTITLAKGRKRGVVKEKLSYSNPQFIPHAKIVHTHEITREEFVSYSNEHGHICIELNPGRYYVEVYHENYQTYSTGSGFSVFPVGYNGTSNFFMER